MQLRLDPLALVVIGLTAFAGCKGAKEGDGTVGSAAASSNPSLLDSLGEEPAMNKFCKGPDGTVQDCSIACSTTKAKDVCDLVKPKTVALCKRIGKEKCQKVCDVDKNEHACEAVKTWVASTCDQAGASYGKLFAKGFSEKAGVKPEKQAPLEKAFIDTTIKSCGTDAWKPETIDCVAAAEDLRSADACVSADFAASRKLTSALSAAAKSVAN